MSNECSEVKQPDNYTIEHLLAAIKDEDVGIINACLTNGVIIPTNFCINDSRCLELFQKAIMRGYTDVVRFMLELNIDCNLKCKDRSGYCVVDDSDDEMIQLIIPHIKITEKDERQRTVLIQLCEYDLVNFVRVLLELPEVDPDYINSVSSEGETALTTAASNCNGDMVSLLLEAGADVDGGKEAFLTALIYACSYQEADIAAMLIKAGANVNISDELSHTPLMFAAMHDNLPLASMLIEAKATLHDLNYKNKTVLTIASEAGSVDIVSLICKTIESGE